MPCSNVPQIIRKSKLLLLIVGFINQHMFCRELIIIIIHYYLTAVGTTEGWEVANTYVHKNVHLHFQVIMLNMLYELQENKVY